MEKFTYKKVKPNSINEAVIVDKLKLVFNDLFNFSCDLNYF